MRFTFACIVALAFIPEPLPARCAPPPRFELKDGDRIVLLGDTLIERDQRYGYLETLLSISNPDKNLVFRNLGWSGDTVGGVSRSGFDLPEAGFEQLRQQILAVKPTVVIVGYGMADSFAGEVGLPAFTQGMSRLLNVIDSTKSRVVFLAPVAHANLGPPLPDPTSHNRDLARYRDVIKRIAQERSAPFIDLSRWSGFIDRTPSERGLSTQSLYTEDGIHLTESGHWAIAVAFSMLLDEHPAARSQLLVLGQDGKLEREEGTKVAHIEKTADGLRFETIDRFLPFPVPGTFTSSMKHSLFPRRLVIHDLAPGKYELKIDGESLFAADSEAWKNGVEVRKRAEFDQAQALRAAINRKNELFFYRWRPQNITYLLGFRKHEQGNNAVEIPQFDPLVAEQEQLIARLKKPVRHVYEVSRVAKEVSR